MSANERLQSLQTALEQRGAKDVKFFFSLGDDVPETVVASHVADVLEAVINSKHGELPRLDDSVKKM